MPRRSFVKAVLGRPSRSYAKEAVSPWSEEPSYWNETASQLSFDLHLAGGGRRAGSDVSYSGPSRGYIASPPASDLGVPSSFRRRPKKASSDIGYVPSASSYSVFPLSARPIVEDERETASEYSEVSESCQRVPPAVTKRQLAPKKSQPPVRHPHFAERVEFMEERSREPLALRTASNESPVSSDTQTSSATASALMSPTSSVTVTAKPTAKVDKPLSPNAQPETARLHAHDKDLNATTGPPRAAPTKPTKEVRFDAPPSPPTPPAARLKLADEKDPVKSEKEPVSAEGAAGSVDSHDAYYTPRSSVESSRSQRSTESDVKTPLAQVAELPAVPIFQVQPPTPLASTDTPEPNYLESSPTRRHFKAGEESDDDGSYEEHVSHTTYAGLEAYDSESAEPGALARPPLPRKSSKRRNSQSTSKPDLDGSPSTGPLFTRPVGVTASGATIEIVDQRPPSRSSDATERPAFSRAPSDTSQATITRSKSSQWTQKLRKERPPQLAINEKTDSDPSPPSSRPMSRASSMSQYSQRSDQLSAAGKPGFGSEMSYTSAVSHQSVQSNASIPGSQSSRGANGKGGWAAASATPVVMYMPTTANDGWAAFQPLPPRSRAAPLPGFHKKVDHGSRSPSTANSSIGGSINGSVRGLPQSASAANSSVGGSSSGSVASGTEKSPSYNNPAGPPTFRNSLPTSASMPLPTSTRMPLNRVSFSPPVSPLASPAAGGFPNAGAAVASPVASPATGSFPNREPALASPVASPATSRFPDTGPGLVAPSPVRLPQKVMPPPVMTEEDSDTDSDDSLPKPSRSYKNVPIPNSPISPMSPGQTSRPGSLSGSRSSSPLGSLNRERRRSMPTASSVASTVSVKSRKSWMPPGPVPPVPPIPAAIASTLPRSAGPPSFLMNSFEESSRPTSPMARASLDRPSSLNPDMLTLLPEMSVEDSNLLYNAQVHGKSRGAMSEVGGVTRHRSLFSRNPRQVKVDKPMSDVGHHRTTSEIGHGNHATQSEINPGYARSDGGHSVPGRPFSPAQSVRSIPGRPFSPAHSLKRAEDGTIDLNGWDAVSSAADIPVMESHGRDQEHVNGYTSLILPRGGNYKPDDPVKNANAIDPRILGMPTSAMAAVTFSSSAYSTARKSRDAPTPRHLQQFLPSPVDFTSHLKPPTKVTKHQILLQVYAVAVDAIDLHACDTKTEADVGKWIPGRSFVGRAITVGAEELDIRRGDIVVGLTDVRKSGALAEYMVVERRRVARVPANTQLSLEQLAELPSQGISAYRALQGNLSGIHQALIMDAHIGIPALLCQQMRRQGISVTAVVPGGENGPEATAQAYDNGARACLSGLPHQIMDGLEEGLFDVIVDTRGGDKTYAACTRVLADDGRIISLAGPRPEGVKTLKRKGSTIKRMFSRAPKPPRFEEIRPAGSGEAEVDLSGLDTRDVLDQIGNGLYEPVVGEVVPFEKAPETFIYKPGTEQKITASIVRIIN